MPHVVTQPCCADAACAFACPVNAIHPTPDEPDFATSDMVYIDPKSCVDCGACVGACPVGAIKRDTKLSEHELPFVEINAMFHQDRPTPPLQAPLTPIVPKADEREVHVAIVGAGPAAMYAADEVLKRPRTRVTVIDRLPVPYGLVRAGVAPDHPDTRTIDRLFRRVEDQRGFDYLLGVEVGVDVTHADLAARHDAVLYATGAPHDRRLGIEGEDLPGSATSTDFVAWYNGHPDHVDDVFDLSHERVVVVGNGNVALDVARILATDPERLATTDIADHALDVLRESRVREVVVLGRRGLDQAAFTLPEITGLLQRDDLRVVVDGEVRSEGAPGAPTIDLRFHRAPVEVEGSDHVTGLRVARTELDADARAVLTDDHELIDTGLVLRSIGYRGRALPDLPFDEQRAVVPHDRGRVDGMPGVYVAGWIKRGPTGFIGTNKTDATETVDRLFEDLNAGLLAAPAERSRLVDLLDHEPIDLAGWRRIDVLERRQGLAQGRPRVRLSDTAHMQSVAAVSPAVRGRTRRDRRVAWGA